MLFVVSSDTPNVIIHAKFHFDRLRGFWAAGPPKVPFPILIGTTLTTVHYRADCDDNDTDAGGDDDGADGVVGRVVLGSFMFSRGKELEHWNRMTSNVDEQTVQWHSLL